MLLLNKEFTEVAVVEAPAAGDATATRHSCNHIRSICMCREKKGSI